MRSPRALARSTRERPIASALVKAAGDVPGARVGRVVDHALREAALTRLHPERSAHSLEMSRRARRARDRLASASSCDPT